MNDNIDERENELKKEAIKMNMTIFSIVFMILGLFWYFPFHIYIRIPVTILMAVSLYYQIMAYKVGLYSVNMIGMKTQERLTNEVGYQATKRGHKILFMYIKDNYDIKIKVKETDMTYFQRKKVKWISIFHVALKPAWGYRDYDEEEEIDEVLEDSYDEIDK